MPNRFQNINGEKVQLTDAEEAARDAEEQAVADAAPATALAKVRQKRDQLLFKTDYFALSDVTMSDAMTTYMQALRDIPSGLDTVKKCEDVTWPDVP